MIVTFGEQPPVYAKPRQGIQTSSTPYPVQREYLLFIIVYILIKNLDLKNYKFI